MRAILFDLDGTLLQLGREYEELLADTFRAVEGECRAEWVAEYEERFLELFRSCEPDPYRRAFATVSANPDALADALREREASAASPPEGAHARLAALAGEYELGVLTNGVREWQADKLRAHDLEGYFDAVVASYEAGAHKPARGPFALAEERLPADEYAMIGDAAADVEGARGAGWTAIRYRGGGFDGLPGALGWE